MEKIKSYLQEKREFHLQELFSFLSLESISALPGHNSEIKKTAE